MRLFGLIRKLLPRRHAGAVSGSLAVLPVLRAQIQESLRFVEQSVTRVCGDFTAIAEHSRTVVKSAADLLDGGTAENHTSVEHAIAAARSAIAKLLDQLERSANLSSRVVSRMEQVEKAVAGIDPLLAEVQKIALSNKLVALNAKIEAVHVGELGSGFEVVADEISRQADRSTQLGESIGTGIREMRERVNTAAGDLRGSLAQDRAMSERNRAEAEAALNLLWSTHERTRESLEAMARENSSLANRISEAVVGLQFQDRVGQRLTHVVEALEKLEQNLDGAGQTGLVPGRPASHAGSAVLREMQAAYTMHSERAAQARVLGKPEPVPEAGDVELF